jgi:lysophospholipase L1-like esterase
MDARPEALVRRAAAVALVGSVVGTLFALQACLRSPEAPPPPSAATPTRLSSPEALGGFFAALDGLDSRRANGVVRILQIGDSHTANDSFSGRMRERLQARFGGAGRGWLPAGIPFKYYRPQLVGVSENGWEHSRATDRDAAGPFGLDAIDAQSLPPDAAMAIESTEPQGFDRFAVEYLARPNGSPFTVRIDGSEPLRVSTASANGAIKRFELPLDRPARRAELRAGERPPVDLLAWDVERHGPGVIYENHGTIGATVKLLGRMTPAAVAFELDERRPALLIVAFGTNEGFDDGTDAHRYAAQFRALVVGLQHAASGASILILGPPDGNRIGRGCAAESCRAGGEAGANDCAWHEPPGLAGIREAQQRVAAEQGWAYWDWFDAMGGQCSIDRMAGREPPLGAPDHIHLTKAGYTAVADLLFAELITEYDNWRGRRVS